jgi:hypothetical protein
VVGGRRPRLPAYCSRTPSPARASSTSPPTRSGSRRCGHSPPRPAPTATGPRPCSGPVGRFCSRART